ncbi:MAG TPA: hypothetical protein VKV37_12660 [Ktedonobacteraceae bacterium]|jgi:hypothetical protein|nr:hypothetical protein [Ktedonobacteraceae bacterium]HLI89535.1 hypothetical protein [Ktedonobacteraceae bacterium]
MRGKLRDKRTVARRDIFKREDIERRRPGKRDSRSMRAFSLQLEEEDYASGDAGEEAPARSPRKPQP